MLDELYVSGGVGGTRAMDRYAIQENRVASWHWHDFWDDWWLVPFLGVVCALNLMLSESESEGEIQSLNLAQKENDDASLAKP
jgi:hypothetical protein